MIMPFRYPLRWKNSRRHKVPTLVAGRLKRRSLRFEPLETRRLMTATKTHRRGGLNKLV